MLNAIFNKIFGSQSDKVAKNLKPLIEKVNSLEAEISQLNDEEIKGKRAEFIKRHKEGESLDDLMAEAFAVAREACKRNIGMRHFDVQLIGGAVLFDGNIAEMSTGEGKTLVAVLPVYLQSIAEVSVHVITVNDYLAQRDAEWIGPAYRALGLSVGFIQNDLEHTERRKAYDADVLYITNNEDGFDYLRNNMAIAAEHQAQGKLSFAIVDEVDSVLIDEARTPLIISGPSGKSSDKYHKVSKIISKLKFKEFDNHKQVIQYLEEEFGELPSGKEGKLIDSLEKKGFDGYIVYEDKSFVLTNNGERKCEQELGIELYKKEIDNLEDGEWVHHIDKGIRAEYFFTKEVNYVVQDGNVVIVDEFSGRLMPGRRWSDGQHQAVEAKEGLKTKSENQTLATITFQNFFKLYDKLAGMTGTALTEQAEFHKIYGLKVITIPTNKQLARKEHPDAIYRSVREKYDAIMAEIVELNKLGRPVLVGSRSIDVSEKIADLLKRNGIPHNVLNAKHHLLEAEIIAQAGRKGAVTISTNMAGRGTDIVLGGNPEYMAKVEMERKEWKHELIIKATEKTPTTNEEEKKAREEFTALYNKFKVETDKEHDEVIEAGGLHVIGSERHESRRIDNQLRGRSGRQGDPGSSRFYVALEDELMRLFGSDKIIGIMDKLGGMEEGERIEHPLISRAIENAQKRIEMMNFDIRKQLLDFDNVMDLQRSAIYSHRSRILIGDDIDDEVIGFIEDYVDILLEKYVPEKTHQELWNLEGLSSDLTNSIGLNIEISVEKGFEYGRDGVRKYIEDEIKEFFLQRKRMIGDEEFKDMLQMILLQVIDNRWKDHLYELDHLKEGISYRAFAQKDPLVEYKRESFMAFAMLMDSIKREVLVFLFRASAGILQSHLTGYGGGQAIKADASLPDPRQRQADVDNVTRSPGAPQVKQRIVDVKVGRNEPCPCGSGKKYKHCCGRQ